MITKTKIKRENDFIFPLALKIKDNYENYDIALIISVLSPGEKTLLKNELLRLKIQVKTPADYEINRRIYRTIAIIIDKSCINTTKQNLAFKTWTTLPLNN